MYKSGKILLAGLVTGLLLAVAPSSLHAATSGGDLNDRLHRVNDAADHNMNGAIQAIAVQTGVPVQRVRALHEQFPHIGISGVLVACAVAQRSGAAPAEVLQKHQSGTSFSSLLRGYNVPVDAVNAQLSAVEQSLKGRGMAPNSSQYGAANTSSGNYSGSGNYSSGNYSDNGSPNSSGTVTSTSTADDLSQHASRVNDLAGRNSASAIHAISVETGVAQDRVQAMRDRFSNLGVTDVLIACVMADRTKQAPEEFLNQRASGKSWSELAQSNKVAMNEIHHRLDNLQRDITGQAVGSATPFK